MYKLLGLALDVWIGPDWETENLEVAWMKIDDICNECFIPGSRPPTGELGQRERLLVERYVDEAIARESELPNYYRTQAGFQRTWSTKQFLSVVAGWELLCLLQEKVAFPGDGFREPHEKVVKRLDPTTVISFNYDTLFEGCLPASSWGYPGLTVGSFRSNVLKLHGSVNWTRESVDGPGDSVRSVDDPPIRTAEMGYTDKGLVQPMLIGLRTKIEHTAYEASPRIRELFLGLLQLSRQALESASTIWVIGYSFPPADTTFQELLRSAMTTRLEKTTEPPRLCVVSKDSPDRVLARLRELFRLPIGHSVDACFCGFSEWANHGFCQSRTIG